MMVTTFLFFPPSDEEIENAGILSVGGLLAGARLGIAEIFNPQTGRSCRIGNVPVVTYGMSLCGNLACGGGQSCFRFNDGEGTFTALSVTMKEIRTQHLCWQLPSGSILLLGSWGSGRSATGTTERLTPDGSSSTADFDLPYDIKFVLILKSNND